MNTGARRRLKKQRPPCCERRGPAARARSVGQVFTLVLCETLPALGAAHRRPGMRQHPDLPDRLAPGREPGGPVLDHATVVAVTFAIDGGDPLVPMIDDFVQRLPGSSFSMLAHEYGVDGIAAGTHIHSTLDLGGAVDDTLWQDRLANELERHLDGFGPPPAQALYLFFVPPGVAVTASGQSGCVDFGGYHSAIASLHRARQGWPMPSCLTARASTVSTRPSVFGDRGGKP